MLRDQTKITMFEKQPFRSHKTLPRYFVGQKCVVDTWAMFLWISNLWHVTVLKRMPYRWEWTRKEQVFFWFQRIGIILTNVRIIGNQGPRPILVEPTKIQYGIPLVIVVDLTRAGLTKSSIACTPCCMSPSTIGNNWQQWSQNRKNEQEIDIAKRKQNINMNVQISRAPSFSFTFDYVEAGGRELQLLDVMRHIVPPTSGCDEHTPWSRSHKH